MVKRQRKPRRVGVLAKVLRILTLIRDLRQPATLTVIAERTGYHKSTVYRMLNHLEQENYLARDRAGAYTFGEGLRKLVHYDDSDAKLRELVRPFLWGLWKATSEAVHLAVLDGREVVYLDALESPLDFRLVSTIGLRAEFYRTALGKAMTASLPEVEREALIRSSELRPYTIYTITDPDRLRLELETVRSRGYAIDQEEGNLGVRCVGVAILGAGGKVAGGMSISGPTSRITQERVQALGNALSDAAREIGSILGGHARRVSHRAK